MTEWRIPFNRPSIVGDEISTMAQALAASHISGDGSFTHRCHELLEEQLGVSKALLTTSGTHALELAALLLDIQPGDDVIVPSFTFVSTANAFVLRGARPIFIDIRPDTLNLDETQLEAVLTPRTRAVVAVHYAGVGCEMDAIGAFAQAHGLAVVEDNAHGLFGAYRGRPLGSFGQLAAQSFHETKNVTCGEGGALLINRRDLVARAEILREKGTDRTRFARGEVDKYGWVDIGSSYLPSDLLAAFLYAQLLRQDEIQQKRRRIWHRYHDSLVGLAAERGLTLPFVPAHTEQAYHMFYLILSSFVARQQLLAHLKREGILAAFHYLPLHSSEFARRSGFPQASCPVTERISARLVRLPFFTNMSDAEVDDVVSAVASCPFSAA